MITYLTNIARLIMPVSVAALICLSACSRAGHNAELDASLIKAVEERETGALARLLDEGASPDSKDADNRTALEVAAIFGNTDAARILVEHGASAKEALMPAAANGHIEIVALLVEKKADLDVKDEYGDTPLIRACFNQHGDIAELLVRSGADIHSRDDSGRTALWAAAANGLAKVTQLLIDNAADINAKDRKFGWTPLIVASINGRANTVKILLDNGADQTAKSNDGSTALSKARENGHPDIVKLLEAVNSPKP